MSYPSHRPIGDLRGVDAQWAQAVIDRLNYNGVDAATVNLTVNRLHSAVASSGGRNLPEILGDPYVFADTVTRNPEAVLSTLGGKVSADDMSNISMFSLGKRIGQPVHLAGIGLVFVLVLSAFTGTLTGMMFRDGTESTPLSYGFVFTIVASLVFFGVIIFAPALWTLKHPILSIFGWVVYFIIIITIGVIWSQPIFMMPRALIVAVAVLCSVGGSIAAWILAARAKRKGSFDKIIVEYLQTLGVGIFILTWGMALIMYFNIDLSGWT